MLNLKGEMISKNAPKKSKLKDPIDMFVNSKANARKDGNEIIKQNICQILWVYQIDTNTLYLGVALVLSEKKNHYFHFIID